MEENSIGIPNDICGVPASARETLAVQLRQLMNEVDGEDKCTLCKAAKELSKSEWSSGSGTDWFFPILLIMLFGGFGSNQSIDPELVKKCLEVMSTKDDSKSEDPNES